MSNSVTSTSKKRLELSTRRKAELFDKLLVLILEDLGVKDIVGYLHFESSEETYTMIKGRSATAFTRRLFTLLDDAKDEEYYVFRKVLPHALKMELGGLEDIRIRWSAETRKSLSDDWKIFYGE